MRESLVVDLRRWIVDDHQAALARFDQAVVPYVPHARWKERAGDGGASIAWLLFHLSYHQDLAISTAAQGEAPVLAGRRAELGLAAASPTDGLGEAEQIDVTEALDLDELLRYSAAVRAGTATYLETLDLASLDQAPATADHLAAAGVTDDAVPWLYRMWTDKTIGWLVQWEAIGHVHGHVGEMISVRSRLGLSPF